jgi:hypothetical protein
LAPFIQLDSAHAGHTGAGDSPANRFFKASQPQGAPPIRAARVSERFLDTLANF